MLTAPGRHEHNLRQSAPAPAPPSLPHCRHCGTDVYLKITGYVPASYALDRESLLPPVVSYDCGHCGSHYAHRAPEDWAPPGWEWYA